MKSSDLNHAMQFIDDQYLDMAEAPQKENLKMSMNENRAALLRLKKPALVALAACLLLTLCATAYAARLFGLLELWNNPNRQLPDTATEYIQPETATGNESGWSCAVTESLSDASNAMATIKVCADDRYLLVSTDATPDDPVSDIGIEKDMTLGELAAAENKVLLYVGATFVRIGGEEIGEGSQHFESISEGEAVILTHVAKTVSASVLDAVCTVYAREDGSEDVQRIELPFTLAEAPATENMVYRNLNPDVIPGLIAGDVQTTKSALGYAVAFPITVTDPQTLENILTVKVDGVTFHEGGGFYQDGGNHYVLRASVGQGKLGNTIAIQFYNHDKEIAGSMTCQRISA